MNELIRFTRPIDVWLKAHSKTNTSYLRKRSIMMHYFSLAGGTHISLIAKQNAVTRQYVNTVVNQIKNFIHFDPRSYLSKLKVSYLGLLVDLYGLTPAPLDKVLNQFKQRSFVPRKLTLQQFKVLLVRIEIKHQIMQLWQLSFLMAPTPSIKDQKMKSKLVKIKQSLEYHLKRKLIMSVRQLSIILGCEQSLLDFVIAHSRSFIYFKSYIIYNWSQQKRKTEFAYLIAKVFALYQKLSSESLLKIIRSSCRLNLDGVYLSKLSDDLLISSLISAGLVNYKQGYFYAEGEARYLMPSERGVIAVLNKTKRLQARHIMSLSLQRNWDKGSNNRLIRSPLLDSRSDGWYQLFPYPQHSLETIKTLF
ncbi:MAG: hypothetical protein Q9M92_04145 [Enterobacterales bacterium]|nr:hypothetical protein [Enterobacterales bacterium]